jgi:hypothetical protein
LAKIVFELQVESWRYNNLQLSTYSKSRKARPARFFDFVCKIPVQYLVQPNAMHIFAAQFRGQPLHE